MTSAPWQTFPALERLPMFAHAFTLRHPEIDVQVDRDEAIRRLCSWHLEVAHELGFTRCRLATASQVHGARVAVAQAGDDLTEPIAESDGIVAQAPGLAVGIYVADCCAVYLADPVSGAFGIVHSGKKGSELGIVRVAIETMQQEFGAEPNNLTVQLSPCIRPPAYEIDFAALIRRDAANAGVPEGQIHDEGVCTSSDAERFYSYRLEKGRTGRMFAILGRKGS